MIKILLFVCTLTLFFSSLFNCEEKVNKRSEEISDIKPQGAKATIKGKVFYNPKASPKVSPKVSPKLLSFEETHRSPADGALITLIDHPKVTAKSNDKGEFALTVPETIKRDGDTKFGIYITHRVDEKAFGLQKLEIAQEKGMANVGEIDLKLTGHIHGSAELYEKDDHTGIEIYIPGTSFQVKTDKEGNFQLGDMPVGNWQLRFEKDGYVVHEMNEVLVAEDEYNQLGVLTMVPKVGSVGNFLINQGTAYSGSKQVRLDLFYSEDTVRYMISEEPDFIDKKWETIAGQVVYKFVEPGFKTLYLMFADDQGVFTTSSADIYIEEKSTDKFPPIIFPFDNWVRLKVGDLLDLKGQLITDEGKLEDVSKDLSWSLEDDALGQWDKEEQQLIALKTGTTSLTVSYLGKSKILLLQITDNSELVCPTGYSLVPANEEVGVLKDFCVSQLEMKKLHNFPVPIAELAPWNEITITDAKIACLSLGAGFDLISNPEWMALARDIESVDDNWLTAADGSPCMKRGSVELKYEKNENSNLLPCQEVTENYAYGAERDEKAKFILSNEEIIWDLAGNLWEWVDWKPGGAVDLGPTDCKDKMVELKNLKCESIKEREYLPSGDATAKTSGIGKVRGGEGGVARRGGNDHANSGLYTLTLQYALDFYGAKHGFRCVYRN